MTSKVPQNSYFPFYKPLSWKMSYHCTRELVLDVHDASSSTTTDGMYPSCLSPSHNKQLHGWPTQLPSPLQK